MRVNYLERVYKGWGNGKLKAVVCEDEEALQLFLEKQDYWKKEILFMIFICWIFSLVR